MAASDNTGEKQKPQLFAPGQTGNPAGRPKGSRNKLGEDFIAALHADFEAHGAETIARVREEKPADYVKVCASLLPKEIKVSTVDDLTDEQLHQRIEQLRHALAPLLAEGVSGASGSAEDAPGSGQALSVQTLQ